MGSQMRMEARLDETHPGLGRPGTGRNAKVANLILELGSVGDLLSDACYPFEEGDESWQEMVVALRKILSDTGRQVDELASLLSEGLS